MLNPIRSIRIYSHGNPCSLKTRYKEKQDKLAKRDVLRSVGRAWITIVHLLLGKGEGEGAAGKGKAGKRVGRLRRVKGKRGRGKGKGVGRLRRGKGERGRGREKEGKSGKGEGGWRLKRRKVILGLGNVVFIRFFKPVWFGPVQSV
jgi:hypothetical protein